MKTCPAPDGFVDNIISEIREIRGQHSLYNQWTEFWSYNCEVEVYDPWADFDEVKEEYGIELLKEKADLGTYNAIVAAVAHREFEELELNQCSKDGATVIYDIKGALPKDKVDARL